MRAPEIENRLHEDNPVPRQLDRLTAQVLMFAQRHENLRIKSGPDKSQKRYLVRPSIRFERPDILSGARVGSIIQHSLGAIATSRTMGTKSLYIFRTFEVRNILEDSPGGVRENFRFEWDETNVMSARRETLYIPSDQTIDMYDLIDNYRLRDDDVAAVTVIDEVTVVSSGDVSLLMKDITDIQGAVDAEHVPYSDKRRNYFDYFAS